VLGFLCIKVVTSAALTGGYERNDMKQYTYRVLLNREQEGGYT